MKKIGPTESTEKVNPTMERVKLGPTSPNIVYENWSDQSLQKKEGQAEWGEWDKVRPDQISWMKIDPTDLGPIQASNLWY